MLIKKTICIDPGHGGQDPGAIGNGLKEKDIALQISLKLAEILKLHDFNVLFTRATDVFKRLDERAIFANANKADLFVSIHCNSANNNSAYGYETYHYPNYSEAKRLAQNIQEEITKNKKLYQQKKHANRGVKTAKFTVLQKTSMTAVLVETAFINNVIDASILKNNTEDFAFAIANAILNFYNISNAQISNNNDSDHWAYKYCEKINKMCDEKGIEGISERRFDELLTRAEAIRLISLTLDLQTINSLP